MIGTAAKGFSFARGYCHSLSLAGACRNLIESIYQNGESCSEEKTDLKQSERIGSARSHVWKSK